MSKSLSVFFAAGILLGVATVSGAFGATRTDTKRSMGSRLIYQTHLGYREEMGVEIEGLTVRVDGVKLSEEKAFSAKRVLGRILSIAKTSEKATCHAGTYVHEVRNGKKARMERGCLTTERFAALEESFKLLQSWKAE